MKTGKYRELQRITVPYARLLGIDEEYSESGAMTLQS